MPLIEFDLSDFQISIILFSVPVICVGRFWQIWMHHFKWYFQRIKLIKVLKFTREENRQEQATSKIINSEYFDLFSVCSFDFVW